MQNDLLNATGKRNAVLDAALDGIASGLSIWTSDFKRIHWNRPFVSISHHQREADRTAGASAGSFCMRT